MNFFPLYYFFSIILFFPLYYISIILFFPLYYYSSIILFSPLYYIGKFTRNTDLLSTIRSTIYYISNLKFQSKLLVAPTKSKPL